MHRIRQKLSESLRLRVVKHLLRGSFNFDQPLMQKNDLARHIPGKSDFVGDNDHGSTLIRQRLAAGCSIRYMVPEKVEAYIAEKGLYRSS